MPAYMKYYADARNVVHLAVCYPTVSGAADGELVQSHIILLYN